MNYLTLRNLWMFSKADQEEKKTKTLERKQILEKNKAVKQTSKRKKQLVCKKSRLYSCTFCDKVFYYAKDLKQHQIDIHKVHILKCKICDQKFRSVSKFQKHSESHREEITILPSKKPTTTNCEVKSIAPSPQKPLKLPTHNIYNIYIDNCLDTEMDSQEVSLPYSQSTSNRGSIELTPYSPTISEDSENSEITWEITIKDEIVDLQKFVSN